MSCSSRPEQKYSTYRPPSHRMNSHQQAADRLMERCLLSSCGLRLLDSPVADIQKPEFKKQHVPDSSPNRAKNLVGAEIIALGRLTPFGTSNDALRLREGGSKVSHARSARGLVALRPCNLVPEKLCVLQAQRNAQSVSLELKWL